MYFSLVSLISTFPMGNLHLIIEDKDWWLKNYQNILILEKASYIYDSIFGISNKKINYENRSIKRRVIR